MCSQLYCPVSQSTEVQLGYIINDSSHLATYSRFLEQGHFCCAAPEEWLLPLLFKNGFYPSNFKFVHLISPLHPSVMMQPSGTDSA